MDGFTRRKEQSKEEIRKAAWALFGQFGVEKVSVTDIARKAGVSHATIYNNFGSKDALVREFVTASVDQLVARVEAVLAPDLPFWEKISAIMQFVSDEMAGPAPAVPNSAFFGSSVELWADPQIQSIRTLAKEKMTTILQGLIREGKAHGEIDPQIPDAAFAIYFEGFMDIFVDPKVHVQFHDNPALIRQLGILMMYGLRGSE